MRSTGLGVKSERSWSPLLVVAVVATAVRLAFALVSFALHTPGLIPDEQQYLELASSVANGAGAEAWFPGYGQSLYDTTKVFMAPLALFFDLLGPSRLIGQLWAAVFGVASAVGAAALAGRIGGRWPALLAGLTVALLPSQILWSSVVLRESLVWFALVAIALAIGTSFCRNSPRQQLPAFVALAAGLLALGFLRFQTMAAVVWAVFVVTLVVSRPGRVVRVAFAGALVLLVPLAAGIGPGGFDLAKQAVPSLGTTRTLLADGAETAFTATTLVDEVGSPERRPTDDTSDEPGPSRQERGPKSPPSPLDSPDERPTRGPDGAPTDSAENPPTDGDRDDTRIVQTPTQTYVVEEGVSANLEAIPRGAVATLLRPFPWEGGNSASSRLASVENLVWYVLYVLAGVGLWASRRRLDQIAFPVVGTVAILALAFLTQGNLGTAFRHRGQVLWALAVLAALGASHLWRRFAARAHPDP